MAKPRPRSKRCRWKYKFYRIFIYEGLTRVKRDELFYVEAFLIRYGVDPTDRKRNNDVMSGYLNKFIDMMDSIPLELRPHNVTVVTPIGHIVRRWSRVRHWNIPPLPKVPKNPLNPEDIDPLAFDEKRDPRVPTEEELLEMQLEEAQ